MVYINNSDLTRKQLKLFILVITFSLGSYKDNATMRDEVAKIINEWTGSFTKL